MTDYFPVTYSTLSTQALVRDVLPEYGLDGNADCRLFSLGVNDTYQINAVANGGYFLHAYRAYDLAVFRWCARLKEQEHVWWPPYLRGYREKRAVNGLDVEAVPLFICARHVWHMGLHTGSVPDWGHGDLGDAYFDRRLGWLRELEADYLTVEGSPDG